MTTVADLIRFLKTKPADMPIVYRCCSEFELLDIDTIIVRKLQRPRPDGWVHDDFGDERLREIDYLVFPGN